jgi:hypothetical protein
MQYMLLIYAPAGSSEPLSDEERNAMYEEYFALSRRLREQDKLVSSHELQPSSTATTVAVRDGETTTVDGPFAETKEVLFSFYVIDVPDLDAAAEWAAKTPVAEYGSVEIRPMVGFEPA